MGEGPNGWSGDVCSVCVSDGSDVYFRKLLRDKIGSHLAQRVIQVSLHSLPEPLL